LGSCIEFVLRDLLDIARVVSLDRDLFEIPRTLRDLRKLLPHPVRLEAATPVQAGLAFPKTLAGFSHTHQITPDVFDLIRDDTDYTASEELWTPPRAAATFSEVVASRESAAEASAP
jgi:hypothetical protein